MNRSTPGLPVHHQLPELTQTHVHWVGDAIQPSHPVVPFSSCLQSLPASGSCPMSQLFAWGGQSIGISASASVLPMNTLPQVFINYRFYDNGHSDWCEWHHFTWVFDIYYTHTHTQSPLVKFALFLTVHSIFWSVSICFISPTTWMLSSFWVFIYLNSQGLAQILQLPAVIFNCSDTQWFIYNMYTCL